MSTSVYDHFAKDFSKTRYSIWNGVRRFMDGLTKYSFVADVGCGNGKNMLYRRDIVIIGNDLSNELTHIASDKTGCDVCHANGLHLPYKSCSMDAVLNVAVLHHLSKYSERKTFVNELIRIARPGGKIFITVWAKEQTPKRKWVPVDGCADGSDFWVPWHASDGSVYQRFYTHVQAKWKHFHLPNTQLFFTFRGCPFNFDKDLPSKLALVNLLPHMSKVSTCFLKH